MAKSTPSRTLPDPILVQPVQELACEAGAATLSWEAVPGATSYIVQIYQGADGRQLLLEEADAQTEFLAPKGTFTAGSTYSWRVLATDGSRESAGANLSPFVAVEGASVAAPKAPVAEAHHDEHEVTYATQEEAELAALGVEPEGFPIKPILVSVAVVMVSVVAIIVVLFMWTDVTHRAVLSASAPNTLSRYPALKAVEDAATRRLTQYEVLNDAQGVYQVPIDRVMTLMDNEAAQGTSNDQIVLPGTRR